jgi:YVTN family beta-propeller protein
MADLPIGTVIAGYRIESVAGRGGMGVVYRATQLGLDRQVALKLIAPEMADDALFRERFKRESRTTASIDHPNVIPVYEAGEADGKLFIAMRYVEGTDLRELIRREGRVSPERTVRIVEQVAAALDAAHRRGLVHRDVKPANALITEDGEEHVYLTDFGLTKHAASVGGMTKTGQFVGTPDYTAPEQIKGERADARTDVYALGCLLFQTLAGRVPYDRDSEVAKMYAHLNDPPPSLAGDIGDPAGPLDEVISRALSKDPAERQPSCGDMARAARAALAGTVAPEAERTVAAGAAAPAEGDAEAAVTQAARTESEGTEASMPTRPSGRVRRPLVVALAGLAAAAVAALAAVSLFGSGGSEGDGGRGGGRPSQAEPTVAASIKVGAGPDGIAVGGGTVWVALSENASVTPIDARTNKARKTVPVGISPDSVAVTRDVVWVSLTGNDGLRRIEQADKAPVAGASVKVGVAPEGVSLGKQLVWVANSGEGSVARVDRASAARVGGPIGVGSKPTGIFVGENSVWVTNNGDGTVSRIDSASSVVQGGPIRVGSKPRGVVEGGGSVWVANSGDDTVSRLDARSGKVVGEPIRVGGEPREVAFGEGAVWVTNSADNTVSRIDPKSGRVLGTPIPVGTQPIGVAAGAGAVWVANLGDNTVTRIDP